jgi:hypothetical protein
MPARPTLARTIFVGLTAGALVLAIGGAVQAVAWTTSWLRSRDLYGGLVATLAIVLLRPVIDACGRWAGGDRAVPAVWFGIAGAAVGLGVGLAMHLDHAFTSYYRFLRPYSSFWEMEPETFLAPIAATIVSAVAYRREPRENRPRSPLWMRTVALAWVGIAALLALGASLRSTHAPPLRGYFDSLPLVGIAPSIATDSASLPAETDGVSRLHDDQPVGPLVLRRYQFERGWHCISRLGRDSHSMPDQVGRQDGPLIPCGTVALRHDAAHHFYLLHSSLDEYAPGPVAFDDRTLETIPEFRLSNSAIADGVSLPRSWIAVAWMVIAMALYAALRPSHAHRWLRHRNAWKSGTLESSGVVRFDDGTASAPAPALVRLAPGKVIVLDERATGAGAPFRDRTVQPPIDASNIAPGDIDSLAEALRHDLAAHEARAMAIALAAFSILAAAASVGLAF